MLAKRAAIYKVNLFKMKTLYTILFFVDMILLIVLSFWFLELVDSGINGITIALMLAGILSCIVLLIYFLLRYIKHPSSDNYT